MKHRQYILGLILLMLLLFASGCTNSFLGMGEEESVQVKVIRLATDLPTSSLAYRQLEEFGRQLAEISDGKWQLALYPEGEWGSAKSMLEYLYLGSLDMLCLSTKNLSSVDKSFAVYQQPLLFADETEVQYYLDSQQGKDALTLLGEKYQPLGWVENGYLYLMQTASGDEWCSLVELEKMVQLKSLPAQSSIYAEKVYYQLQGVFCQGKWWSECNETEQKLITDAFKMAQERSRANYEALLKERLAATGVVIQALPPEIAMVYQAQWLAVKENYFAQHSNSLTKYWRPVVTTEVVLGI